MQSPNHNTNDQDNDELNHVQQKINQTTNESLESTRRTLKLIAETQDTGNNTMIMLDQQGEKLKQIEVRTFVNRFDTFYCHCYSLLQTNGID
jgi:hypothetical protein